MRFAGTDSYLTNESLRSAVDCALALQKPLLVKGEPGTGKTLLAEAISKALNLPLLTWHVKSTTRAQDGLYVYDAVQRLHDSRFGDHDVRDIKKYIRLGPLGESFAATERKVLLIDEIDKADLEFPNDLLHEIDRMRFRITETNEEIVAKQRPVVIITSNNEKDLPDAFLRRCVFHFIEFPDEELMRRIVTVHHPKLSEALVDQAMKIFFELRALTRLRKRPSTSELIDWLAALKASGINSVTLDQQLPFIGSAVETRTRPASLLRSYGPSQNQSLMFTSFIYELRSRKVPVGTHEAVALAQALMAGLHESSLDGFYHLGRALLVHDEKHLDAYDQAFGHHFRGIESAALDIHQQLLEWLKEAKKRGEDLTPEELALLEQLDPEEIERRFQERLKEQKERHDGGNKWIGTGGTSPFGHSGRAARPGIRVGGSGGMRSAMRVAGERGFREYRDDVVLDVRQMSLALRKLRAFSREGQPQEIDVDDTIAKTARNLGELEVSLRAERKSNTRVILLMDVGGSMDPYAQLVSRLFTSAKKATHFKELRTYYFHNCIYGRVYTDAGFYKPIKLPQLFSETDRRYKLIVLGDALMAPWELMSVSGEPDEENLQGIGWLMTLRDRYPNSVWLNPEPQRGWGAQSIRMINALFPMYPLTLEGLGDAVGALIKSR